MKQVVAARAEDDHVRVGALNLVPTRAARRRSGTADHVPRSGELDQLGNPVSAEEGQVAPLERQDRLAGRGERALRVECRARRANDFGCSRPSVERFAQHAQVVQEPVRRRRGEHDQLSTR